MKQYYIKQCETYGRGIYTTHELKRGEVLFMAELLVLSEHDTKIVNESTDLKYYTFKYNDIQDCLVLGDGEIFNHSSTPNVGYKLESYGPRKAMVFYMLKDAELDEQLFIDYNADIAVQTETYINKNLI